MCLSPPPLTPTACGIPGASDLVDLEAGVGGCSWGLHSPKRIGNSDAGTPESRCLACARAPGRGSTAGPHCEGCSESSPQHGSLFTGKEPCLGLGRAGSPFSSPLPVARLCSKLEILTTPTTSCNNPPFILEVPQAKGSRPESPVANPTACTQQLRESSYPPVTQF